MLSRYGMTGCKPIFVPLEENVKLGAKQGELFEDVTVYRYIVSSLICMTINRVCYGIGELVYVGAKEATFGCN